MKPYPDSHPHHQSEISMWHWVHLQLRSPSLGRTWPLCLIRLYLFTNRQTQACCLKPVTHLRFMQVHVKTVFKKNRKSKNHKNLFYRMDACYWAYYSANGLHGNSFKLHVKVIIDCRVRPKCVLFQRTIWHFEIDA